MDKIEKVLKGLLSTYTQEELARELEISLRSLQNYLAGTEPSKAIARKIREFKPGDQPIEHPDARSLVTGKVIQIEAMQRVTLSLLQELFAKSQGISNMEAGTLIDKTIDAELQKIKAELKP